MPRRLLLLCLLTASVPAAAQDTGGFDAHGFDLATLTADPRAPLAVERPARFDGGDFGLGAVFEYAALPLAAYDYVDGQLTGQTPVLDDLFAINTSASFAVWERARLGVAVPMFLTSTGEGGTAQGADIGDVRLNAMIAVVRPDDADAAGFGLGVVPFLVLPTGDEAAFLGQSGVTGGGKVAAGWEGAKLTVGGDVGVQIEPAIELENLTGADRFQLGAHAGWLFADDLGVSLEARMELPLRGNEYAGTDLPAEALLSARKRTEGGGHYLAGLGLGLSRGASAAPVRVFLGGGFGTPERAVDTDGDGLVDKADPCPTEPETVNEYKDSDGCPDRLPTIAVTVTRDGVAVASAKVNVADGTQSLDGTSGLDPWVVDTQPGRTWSGKATFGACLAGIGVVTSTDADEALVIPLQPVRDAQVAVEVVDPKGTPIPGASLGWAAADSACAPSAVPTVGTKAAVGPGNHTATATAPGFRAGSTTVTVASGDDKLVQVVLEPMAVRLTAQRIELLEPVFFDYNLASVRADSFRVLEDVLQILREHPEFLKIEINGHTDSDGSAKYNQDLSQRRVDTVRAWLIERGIAAERLVAKGYGESKPVTSNATEAGKAKNRRVEFVITERAPDAAVKP